MSDTKRWKKSCVLCFTSDSDISYFSIPTDNRRPEWLHLCNITWEIPKTAKLCEKHFSTESYTKNTSDVQCRKRLKAGAVPTQFLDCLNNPIDTTNDEENRTGTQKWCFICGSERDPKRSYHRFPKEIDHRNLWLTKLGKEESSVPNISNVRLCSVHFSPNDFIENPRTRKRYLKSDAVPSLSPEQTAIPNDLLATPVEIEMSGAGVEISVNSESDASFVEISDSIESIDTQPQCTPQRVTYDKACQTEDNLFSASSGIDTGLITPTTTTNRKDPLNDHSYIAPENVSKKHLPLPRYVGDICTPHLSTPNRAKRCLEMSKSVIEEKNKTIQSLTRKLKSAQEKINTLNDLINHLRSTNYISETATHDLLMLYPSRI